MKKIFGIFLGILSTSLVACGGGSSNSSFDTKTNTTDEVITTTCSKSSVVGVTTHEVTAQGCILKLKKGDQTGFCSGKTLYMLTGTGFSQKTVKEKGSQFTGVKFNLNDEIISCL